MEKILIFRTGQIGDFVVALPALWNVRRRFPEARITLLSDVHRKQEWVPAPQLLEGTGIVDEFDRLLVGGNGRVSLLSSMVAAKEMLASNPGRFDAVLDLGPFRPAGIGKLRMTFFLMVGREYFGSVASEIMRDSVTGHAEFEGRRLDRIAATLTGANIDFDDSSAWSLRLGKKEEQEFFGGAGPLARNRLRIAVCCGAKMASKRWPIDRYLTVLQALDRKFSLDILIFGGEADRGGADFLAQNLLHAKNFCGVLSPRGSAFGISTCDLYFGNDTGPMHLAASVGLPCVALFSARDWPGKWWPIGERHRILRKSVSCGGCMLTECRDEGLRCLMDISPDEALQACVEVIQSVSDSKSLESGSSYAGLTASGTVEESVLQPSNIQRFRSAVAPKYIDRSPRINLIAGGAYSSTGGIQTMNRLLLRELGAAGLLRQAHFLWDNTVTDAKRTRSSDEPPRVICYGEDRKALLRNVVGQALRRPEDLWLCTHINYAALGLLAGAGRVRRVGVMLHAAELDGPLTFIKRFAMRRAGLVIAVSEFTKKKAIKLGVHPARVHVSQNGVDDPCPEWQPSTQERGTKNVLFVGRMDEHYKGQRELIDSLSLLCRRLPEIRLVFVGGGKTLDEWKAETERRGLSSLVEFTGLVSDDRLRELYASATVFAMISENEGFGLVYAEAMAHGIPCLGSACDAAREVISHGETGFCLPVGNSTALAEAIQTLVKSPDLRARMGEAGRRRFAKNFAADCYRRRLLHAMNAWRTALSSWQI